MTFPFMFDSGYVYTSLRAEVQPTSLYPNGLVGNVILCTMGDAHKHQKWNVFTDFTDAATGSSAKISSRIMNLYRATHSDGSHLESHLSTVDLVGTDCNQVMMEYSPRLETFEGEGTIWVEEGTFQIRTEIHKHPQNNHILFRRFLRKKACEDWNLVIEVLFHRVCEYMF